MKKSFSPLSFFFLLFLSTVLQAQEVPVKFKIINSKREPVPFATIKIISVADTALVQQSLTDSSGIAVFNLIHEQFFIVKVSSVNYKLLEKNIHVSGGQALFTLMMEPLEKSLENVVVTSTRPVLRQEDDKTIVDPESLAASS